MALVRREVILAFTGQADDEIKSDLIVPAPKIEVTRVQRMSIGMHPTHFPDHSL